MTLGEFEHACSIAESLRRTLPPSELASSNSGNGEDGGGPRVESLPLPPPPPPSQLSPSPSPSPSVSTSVSPSPSPTALYRQPISLDALSRPHMIAAGAINPHRVWTTLTPSYQPEVRGSGKLCIFYTSKHINKTASTLKNGGVYF